MTSSIEHVMPIRVRYSETDAMGFLHHANYFNYFEMGRTELFRQQGGNYRRMEELGLFLVVSKLNCRYRRPARYDDELMLQTLLISSGPVKLIHEYKLFRGKELLAEADSTLACVNRDGEVCRIPANLEELTAEERGVEE
ncbi:MAG TPA: thioesterase family protein [Planctomycetaceae bacterium]|nr:thioesterase family protein [Planctomycetaceae bacterium]